MKLEVVLVKEGPYAFDRLGHTDMIPPPFWDDNA